MYGLDWAMQPYR